MKSLKEAIQNRSDFEDFIYERVEDLTIYHNKTTVMFLGGLFIFEETHTLQDINGFEIGTTIEKKYCTIEKVRRELVKKEAQGEPINSWNRYDEDQAIAHIVLLYGA